VVDELQPVEVSTGARGKVDRLEEAYLRSAPAGLRLAYFLTGDRDQAQDLVQDAFVRLGARFRHLRPIDDVDAYLRRTIVNLFSSSLRRRRTERAWLAKQHGAEPAITSPSDPAERDEMWRALQALPDRQRAAVVLRYYEDLPERDAAAVLGCSSRALNSLIARALGTLRSVGVGGGAS
jgi:RNA polymerase sigma-70 factor (sigma-E family)